MPRPKRKAVEAPEVVIPVLEEPPVPVVVEEAPKPVEIVKPASNISKGRVTLRCQ